MGRVSACFHPKARGFFPGVRGLVNEIARGLLPDVRVVRALTQAGLRGAAYVEVACSRRDDGGPRDVDKERGAVPQGRSSS